MASSSADKSSAKSREELDMLIDCFEQDLSSRLDALVAHFNGYADTILSMTSADDDQYVCDRINGILREHGLLPDESPSPER